MEFGTYLPFFALLAVFVAVAILVLVTTRGSHGDGGGGTLELALQGLIGHRQFPVPVEYEHLEQPETFDRFVNTYRVLLDTEEERRGDLDSTGSSFAVVASFLLAILFMGGLLLL